MLLVLAPAHADPLLCDVPVADELHTLFPHNVSHDEAVGVDGADGAASGLGLNALPTDRQPDAFAL